MKPRTWEYVACALCGRNMVSPYCRVGEFNVVRCAHCGLFYTNPRVPAESASDIYTEAYFLSHDPSVLGYDDYGQHAKGLKQVFSEHLDVIERFVTPPASVLDIGCAFGYFLDVAISRGWTAEGVEVSSFAAAKAIETAGARVHTGTLKDAVIEAASFDAATMWDMLEHSFDPRGELIEANRILKMGGYLFLSVPDAGSLLARLMGPRWFGFKSAAEHNYFFSRKTLRQLLEETGFEVVTMTRGVWPCSMRFLVTKLEPYSRITARLAARLVQCLAIENAVVKFRFIDMFVVARKSQQ